ncbi:nucleotidyltransferase family protein [Fusibacter ferrireducens]|uniref:Nucleotidyltransferase domain-containing protein n=1 Tax=Fusibacter ferrireducens TaxID=2785058 RepID=A0ABR9ZSJ6_9FIRM|nr:nucleotidyltransferase domain-containing protein [Fusibacter ferrireducens]MBF4693432.1 nucleotidyltransferase domain-containing protein [Fusibacter ferrireducens]
MSKAIHLTQGEIVELKRMLSKHLKDEMVILFGSRINGKFHTHSDLDLAIKATDKLPWSKMSDLRETFEEASFPFRIDFLDYHRISTEF